ncbi:DUF6452 family protein [Nonlabens spongiae]|nr:DUF6452 family protein [Nonlabens spongiae]
MSKLPSPVPMNKLLFFTLFVFLLASSGCERDDLCTPDQETSSRMVVVFKDFLNPDTVKPVENLRVRVLGASEYAPLDFEGSTSLEMADTVYIPLRNFDDQTIYDFETDNEEDGFNIDRLNFSYTRQDEFVSRACGFKVNYNDLQASRQQEIPNQPWIIETEVIDSTVNNRNEVHVEIFH